MGIDVTGKCYHAGVVSSDIVGQVRIDLQRAGGGGDAVHVHVAAHCLTGDIVGGLILGGAKLAVAGDMDDGQLGVLLPAGLIGEAALGIGTGTAGLDPNVSPLDALVENLLAGGRGGVDGDGILVSVVLGPGVGAAGLAGDVGSFGLQNFCAHLSHQAAGEGAGNVGAGHEDLDALQNAKFGILIEFLRKLVVNNFHYSIPFSKFGIGLG